MKVLIIEDEPFAQQELKRLLGKLSVEIEILDMIDTVEDSVEWLKLNPAPDLIFLDIQLADGLSFEIFKQIKIEAPVIFTTAFDEYAIQAFRLNSVDYLLKPIKINDLKNAMAKLEAMKKQFATQEPVNIGITPEQLQSLLQLGKPEYKSRFVARVGDQIKYVPVGEVAYFYAEDNVVFMVSIKNDRYIIEHSIEELESLIDPKDFFRLNRGFLAHIGSINKVYKYMSSRLKIELKPETEKEVLVSRARVSEFMEWMER